MLPFINVLVDVEMKLSHHLTNTMVGYYHTTGKTSHYTLLLEIGISHARVIIGLLMGRFVSFQASTKRKKEKEKESGHFGNKEFILVFYTIPSNFQNKTGGIVFFLYICNLK